MPVKRGLWLLLALLSVTAVAAVAEEEAPPLALLEYLGEWQDVDGNEIDPQELALLQLETVQGGGESHDEK